ncbi:Transmembrane protein [Melia azedarach]|uniref:Transmembrane protein n=1 Tax=Melia azedarach TaxID=155640 RepID=A0ACC1YV02_MELAZ|nr:Transmembrane protein [Melia azedarach]
MGGTDHGHAGEGAHGDFRGKVWSMTGGPYCRPKHWKRNTAIAMAGVFLICIPIAMKSAELELWCKNFGTKDY